MFVFLLKLVPWLLLLGSLSWTGFKLYTRFSEKGERSFRGEAKTSPPRPGLALQIILILVALFGIVAFGTATEVGTVSLWAPEMTSFLDH